MTILSGKPRPWGKPDSHWPSTPEGERRQAADVERIYTLLFSHPAVEAITWWDFSDHHAWRRAPAGLLRADMTPKPAYERLLKLVKQKWWTKQTLQSDNTGTAPFRGFLGDYTVVVTVDGKKETAKSFALEKGSKNRWTMPIDAQLKKKS